MLLSYSLDKDLSCEKVCKDLAKLVEKFRQEKENLSDCVLVIDLKQTINSNQSLLTKIEYKGEIV